MASGEFVDQTKLKKLRLRIDTDDPLYLGMKKLKVRGRDLGNLPTEIFHISELEVLDLSPEREACLYYRLGYLPATVGKLTNLRVLMIDTNELGEVPEEIALLTNLEGLSVSNNQLKKLPDLSSLSNLTSLHASNNKIDTFPESLCHLHELRFLDLSDNKLTDIPSGISNMTGLESLLLYINRLTELPDEICDLVELRCLWIGSNNISRLPRYFGSLKNLDWGFRHTPSTAIEDNPIQHPPIQICRQGVLAIENYFTHADPTTPKS